MFKRVLVANRGEIAVRVMRSCRQLGIGTVAVYSEADRHAPHVQAADDAVCIGPPRPAQSYLSIDNVLAAARQTGAEAIHPGYGFLSENPTFAERCQEEGIVFIGPNPAAISVMGNKLRARALAQEQGVPCVPGSADNVTSAEQVRRLGDALGYPVILKAAAGGGGRGMRVIRDPSRVDSAFQMAVREAASAFGDGTVYLEKYFEDQARHIEVQVLADTHGEIVHLGERECSIQRRHQKLIEESPSAVVDPGLRSRLGESAIKVARAVQYTNAGTVEFLVDVDLNFYFLEMNTRLQVEHPVTEMITGVDIVQEMLRIASGERLEIGQAQVRASGHAVECRVYAENPRNQFLPSPGRIQSYDPPIGEGIRVDSGYATGTEVGVFYDSLLAKVIAWGPDRGEAIRRMAGALDTFRIEGIHTTLPFMRWVMAEPHFAAGDFHTGFVNRWVESLKTASV